MSAPDCVEQLYLFGKLPLVGLRSKGRLVLLLLCYMEPVVFITIFAICPKRANLRPETVSC